MSELPVPVVKPEVPLVVVGYDFRVASAALREKLVTTGEERVFLFDSIKRLDDSAGLLILETCNRLEWIVSTQHPEWMAELLKARMLNRWQEAFPRLSVLPSPYAFIGGEAVTHVLRVVVGLESLAMGEAQIAGQFQSALKRAQKEKTSTATINRLGHIAGRIAKSGYKMGFRSNYRQGIHGLVVQYMEQHFEGKELKDKRVLVAGMGDIGKRTAALISETFKCSVQPLNRTIKPEYPAHWRPLSDLHHLSIEADVLVVATGAPVAIISETCINHSERAGGMLIIDIGIPRQVSEALQEHRGVEYRNVDHLVDREANDEKLAYVDKLEKEIEKEFERFTQFCRGREMSDLLSGIHNGRLELTESRIPEFVDAHLSDLDPQRRKVIESAMKKFIKDYSNDIFFAFHNTMEKYWSTNNGQNE